MNGERGGGRVPWGRLLAEFFAIVAGVLVALAVDAWVAGRAERELADEALRSLEAELAANQAQIDRRIQYRQSVLPALDSLASAQMTGSTMDVMMDANPMPQGTGFWLLRRTAWESAQISDAVRHMDLSTLSLLSLTYSLHEPLREMERNLMAAMVRPDAFIEVWHPGTARFLLVMMNDVLGLERELSEFHSEALRVIRETLGIPGAGSSPGVDVT